MRAARWWMMVVLAAAPGAAAQAQGEPRDGSELGQKLRERLPPSGELQRVDVSGQAADVGDGTPGRLPTRERPVTDPRDERAPRARKVTVAQAEKAIGGLELQRRFDELGRCRAQVALDRRVAVEDVRAGKVLVRFTIGERGAAEDVAVDAVEPTDPAVLDCVYARATAWRFERAPGERLALSRTLSFARPPRR